MINERLDAPCSSSDSSNVQICLRWLQRLMRGLALHGWVFLRRRRLTTLLIHVARAAGLTVSSVVDLRKRIQIDRRRWVVCGSRRTQIHPRQVAACIWKSARRAHFLVHGSRTGRRFHPQRDNSDKTQRAATTSSASPGGVKGRCVAVKNNMAAGDRDAGTLGPRVCHREEAPAPPSTWPGRLPKAADFIGPVSPFRPWMPRAR
ncbi:hypothetical protein C2E23DRAFT_161400 [Lenzites betulinus]|nr:hypothetical protein C2E23DRAFT_161400 [Lenzites betulinus]